MESPQGQQSNVLAGFARVCGDEAERLRARSQAFPSQVRFGQVGEAIGTGDGGGGGGFEGGGLDAVVTVT